MKRELNESNWWGKPQLARWAALPLRLMIGCGLIEHGYSKLVKGPAHFVELVRALGVPMAGLAGRATIAVELLGGVAILAGAFVPWVSIPIAGVLWVAMFTTQLANGFNSIKLEAVTDGVARFGQPGYETNLLYLACLAALILGGAGPYSVDAVLLSRRKTSCA
jgi:putative oxidoreductase